MPVFVLEKETVRKIIYGMENQDRQYLFDSVGLELVELDAALASEPASENGNTLSFESRYYTLPEWTSVQGFALMENFVAELKNPIFREQLRDVLSSGRGVFRQFKLALKERKDIEMLWYRFKERSLMQTVVDWYNGLRQVWGLEGVQFEIDDDSEEFESYIRSEFDVVLADAADAAIIVELDNLALEESLVDLLPAERRYLISQLRRSSVPPGASEGSQAFVVKSPAGELVGFLWFQIDEQHDSGGTLRFSKILQLYTEKPWRGLGIGKTLLSEYARYSKLRKVHRTWILVPNASEFLLEHFRNLGAEEHFVCLAWDSGRDPSPGAEL